MPTVAEKEIIGTLMVDAANISCLVCKNLTLWSPIHFSQCAISNRMEIISHPDIKANCDYRSDCSYCYESHIVSDNKEKRSYFELDGERSYDQIHKNPNGGSKRVSWTVNL